MIDIICLGSNGGLMIVTLEPVAVLFSSRRKGMDNHSNTSHGKCSQGLAGWWNRICITVNTWQDMASIKLSYEDITDGLFVINFQESMVLFSLSQTMVIGSLASMFEVHG